MVQEYLAANVPTATPTTHVLSITISPAGTGSIIPSPKGTYVGPGKMSWPHGTTVILTAVRAAFGYQFARWTGDIASTANPVTIVMTSDKAITAVFEKIPEEVTTYDLLVMVSGSGQVSPSVGEFTAGSKVTLTAKPFTGNRFAKWSGDASGTTNPITITMNDDKNITAHFELIPAPTPTPTPIPTPTPAPTPTPLPTAVWRLGATVSRLEISKVALWIEGARVDNLNVSTTPLWREQEEVVGLSISPTDVWFLGDEVSNLPISRVSVWELQSTIESLIVMPAEPVPEPPTEEKEEITWWPWVLGGVALVVLVVFLARRR